MHPCVRGEQQQDGEQALSQPAALRPGCAAVPTQHHTRIVPVFVAVCERGGQFQLLHRPCKLLVTTAADIVAGEAA